MRAIRCASWRTCRRTGHFSLVSKSATIVTGPANCHTRALEERDADADTALKRALDAERQLIDEWLDLVDLDVRMERNEPEAHPLARFRCP